MSSALFGSVYNCLRIDRNRLQELSDLHPVKIIFYPSWTVDFTYFFVP